MRRSGSAGVGPSKGRSGGADRWGDSSGASSSRHPSSLSRPARSWSPAPYSGRTLPARSARTGRCAVYATWTEDRSFPTIDVVDADGQNPRTVVASEDDSYDCPAFSPGGRQIAYLSAAGSRLAETVSVDGSGARSLDAVVSRQGGAGDRPFDWSPDSSAIAYSPNTLATDGTGPLNALDIMSLVDGTVTRVKVASVEQVLDAAWAPDGRRIAILGYGGNTVNDRSRSRLFTVRADGTGSATAHGDPRSRGRPPWSRLVVARQQADGTTPVRPREVARPQTSM